MMENSKIKLGETNNMVKKWILLMLSCFLLLVLAGCGSPSQAPSAPGKTALAKRELWLLVCADHRNLENSMVRICP